MSTLCKGFCIDYKAERTSNGFRYDVGQKRCTVCSLYLRVDTVCCPCCGARLRSKARHRESGTN